MQYSTSSSLISASAGGLAPSSSCTRLLSMRGILHGRKGREKTDHPGMHRHGQRVGDHPLDRSHGVVLVLLWASSLVDLIGATRRASQYKPRGPNVLCATYPCWRGRGRRLRRALVRPAPADDARLALARALRPCGWCATSPSPPGQVWRAGQFADLAAPPMGRSAVSTSSDPKRGLGGFTEYIDEPADQVECVVDAPLMMLGSETVPCVPCGTRA